MLPITATPNRLWLVFFLFGWSLFFALPAAQSQNLKHQVKAFKEFVDNFPQASIDSLTPFVQQRIAESQAQKAWSLQAQLWSNWLHLHYKQGRPLAQPAQIPALLKQLNTQLPPEQFELNQCKLNIGVYMTIHQQIEGLDAAALFEEVIQAAKRQAQYDLQLHALYRLGEFYRSRYHFDQAEIYFRKAIRLYAKHRTKLSPKRIVAARNSLAIVLRNTGRIQEARTHAQESVRLVRTHFSDKTQMLAPSLNTLAIIEAQEGYLQHSIKLFKEIIEIDRAALGDTHPYLAISYRNLSNLYYDLGMPHVALQYIRQALHITQKSRGPKHPSTAAYLQQLHNLLYTLRELPEAEETINEALAIYKQLGDDYQVQYAQALFGKALLLEEYKKYPQALNFKMRALKITQTHAGEVTELGHTLYRGIANHWRLYRKQPQKALPYAQKAVDIARKMDGDFGTSVARTLHSLASCHLENKAYAKALTYIREGLYASMGDYPKNAQRLPDFSQHEKTFFYSYEQVDKLLYLKAQTHWEQYIAHSESEALQAAWTTIWAIVDFYDLHRAALYEVADKLTRQAQTQAVFDLGLRIAQECYSQTQDPQFLERAFILMERNKGRLLLDAIQQNKALLQNQIPDSLAQEETALRLRIDRLQNEIHQNSTSSTYIAAQKTRLFNTRKAYEQLQNHLQTHYPAYYQLKFDYPFASLQQLRQALPPKGLFVSYMLGTTTTYLLAIDAQTLQLIPIDSTSKLEASVNHFQTELLSNLRGIQQNPTYNRQQYIQQAHLLYQQLLGAHLSLEQYEHLLIVPDAQLHYLPFETLLYRQATTDDFRTLPYLLRQFPIQYAYSATLWLQNQTQTTSSATSRLLAMAGDYPVQSAPQAQRSSRIGKLRQQLTALPGAQEEVSFLERHFEGTFLYGTQASERMFKQQVEQHQILHLALHGILDDLQPLSSGLVFTETTDSLEDDILYAYELLNMKLPPQLAVLSACETGAGQYARGEGVLSLGRSFMFAGVPSLIMSLWQVNDQATQTLMHHFYTQLAEGTPKDIALQRAKLQYLEQAHPRSAHPFYWAAFVSVGDARPLPLITRGTSFYWWILAGGGLLLGGALLFWRYKIRQQLD